MVSSLEVSLRNTATAKNEYGLSVVEEAFWKKLILELDAIDDFKEFFIAVRKATFKMTIYDLDKFSRMMDYFLPKYGNSAIVYLKDTIDTNFELKSRLSKKYNEGKMTDYIVKNFSSVFPKYEFVEKEFCIPTIGRIDILAKLGEDFVVIEVKSGNRTPNTQLFSYATAFTNPILIGITEKPLSDAQKSDLVQYYVFDDLKQANPLVENV